MDGSNPYQSAESDATSVSPDLMQHVAQRLLEAKRKPPSLGKLLLQWRGVPRQVLFGCLGTAYLSYLADQPNAPITSHWPVGFACFLGGSMLTSILLTRRVSIMWPAQERLIDWDRVEQFAGEGEHVPEG